MNVSDGSLGISVYLSNALKALKGLYEVRTCFLNIIENKINIVNKTYLHRKFVVKIINCNCYRQK